jgi:hypothetical protein
MLNSCQRIQLLDMFFRARAAKDMDIRIEQARHRRYARIDLFVDG